MTVALKVKMLSGDTWAPLGELNCGPLRYHWKLRNDYLDTSFQMRTQIQFDVKED
jgi:hypothetical protein